MASQQARRAAIEREWREYSAEVRRRRNRCEAGPRWLTIIDEARAAGILTERMEARLHRAAAECATESTAVHHKRSRGLGPKVPSQGLTDDDVVAICTWCHDAAENNLRVPARMLDILR